MSVSSLAFQRRHASDPTGVPLPMLHSTAPATMLSVIRARKGTAPRGVRTSTRSPVSMPRARASAVFISTVGSGLSRQSPSMPWCWDWKSVCGWVPELNTRGKSRMRSGRTTGSSIGSTYFGRGS